MDPVDVFGYGWRVHLPVVPGTGPFHCLEKIEEFLAKCRKPTSSLVPRILKELLEHGQFHFPGRLPEMDHIGVAEAVHGGRRCGGWRKVT